MGDIGLDLLWQGLGLAKASLTANSVPLAVGVVFGAWAKDNAAPLALKAADRVVDLALKIPGAGWFIVTFRQPLLGVIDWIDRFSDMFESRLKERITKYEETKTPPAPEPPKP